MPVFSVETFEQQLEHLLQTLLTRGTSRTPENLADSIRYSLLSPGKRFRPRLVHAAAQALELKPEVALAAAIALEMTHCFTLIHDDLPCMDNDDFRRGRPSNHKKFGEGTALLAGDSLIGLAFESLLRARVHGIPAERVLAAVARLAAAIGPRGVCGGQAAEALLTPQSSLPDLERMHAQKTGALFVAALVIPRELAGLAEGSPVGAALEIFAHEFGRAFQIWDDLEDGFQDLERSVSILNHLSFEDAQARGLAALESGTAQLRAVLGDRCDPLTDIGDDLWKKIKELRAV